MSEPIPESTAHTTAIDGIKAELARSASSRHRRLGEKFLLAAIGGIPWVGGFLAAAASIPREEAGTRADDLRTRWLEEHQRKLADLGATLEEIGERFEKLGPSIDERIQSPAYLALVRQAFRVWDRAGTAEKRRCVSMLLANSAGTRVCNDDVIRLFIGWLDTYHEAHFSVIREVFANPGSTRYDIWTELYGPLPREDSGEADLYKLLIRDLSTGGVIRQGRDTNEAGQFLRKRVADRRRTMSPTVESAFEDSKQYVLTELGKQFVH